MLAEDDENIRRRAVDKILELRSEASATTYMESPTLESSRKDVVQQFKVPKINVESTYLYELTNLDSIKDISQPPALMELDDTSIAQMVTKPLVLQHPCHNQAVERHVKLVTEAASVVTGYEREMAWSSKRFNPGCWWANLTQNNNLFETNILYTGPVVTVAQANTAKCVYGLSVCERQFHMYFDLPAIMLNLTNIVISIC